MKRNAAQNLLAVVTIAALVAALSACGGDTDTKPADGDTSAKSVENDPPELENENIEAYFQAVVSEDPDALAEAENLAAPGSIAAAYVKYQQAGVDASIDGGTPYEPSELTKVDDGYKNCSDPGDSTNCVVWSNFESEGGKLASFTVNDEELADRISVGDASKVKAGKLGEVEFLVAYQSVQTGDLVVAMRISSLDEPVLINSGSASYRGTDKRQSQNSVYLGIDELGADSTGTLALVFPRAKAGGQVTLTLNSEDFARSSDAKFKTG